MTDEALPLIGVIAKLELKPDDIIVFKSRKPIPSTAAKRIEEFCRVRLALPNKIIILEDIDIEVISPTEQTSDTARPASSDS